MSVREIMASNNIDKELRDLIDRDKSNKKDGIITIHN